MYSSLTRISSGIFASRRVMVFTITQVLHRALCCQRSLCGTASSSKFYFTAPTEHERPSLVQAQAATGFKVSSCRACHLVARPSWRPVVGSRTIQLRQAATRPSSWNQVSTSTMSPLLSQLSQRTCPQHTAHVRQVA